MRDKPDWARMRNDALKVRYALRANAPCVGCACAPTF
jgi:hypothetical protein